MTYRDEIMSTKTSGEISTDGTTKTSGEINTDNTPPSLSYDTYLTDAELESLINDVEMNYMLTAPSHIKGDILGKINRDKHRAKVINIATYRLKIAIACAASILLFCTYVMTMPTATERIMYNVDLNQQNEQADSRTDNFKHEAEEGGCQLIKKPTTLEQMYRKEAREEQIKEFKDTILEKIPEFGRIK